MHQKAANHCVPLERISAYLVSLLVGRDTFGTMSSLENCPRKDDTLWNDHLSRPWENIGSPLENGPFFSQKTHRQNPCSLYLLASTICRLTTLNISLIPIIYALDHPDQRNTSLIFCKLQYYFRHVPNQMMRSFIILACVDRYALCSIRPRIRSFSQYWVGHSAYSCHCSHVGFW